MWEPLFVQPAHCDHIESTNRGNFPAIVSPISFVGLTASPSFCPSSQQRLSEQGPPVRTTSVPGIEAVLTFICGSRGGSTTFQGDPSKALKASFASDTVPILSADVLCLMPQGLVHPTALDVEGVDQRLSQAQVTSTCRTGSDSPNFFVLNPATCLWDRRRPLRVPSTDFCGTMNSPKRRDDLKHVVFIVHRVY